MADFGVSFMPTPQNGGETGRPTAVEPVQEAIKILSLRLPKVVGGGAIAPAPLLNAPGAGGNPLGRSALAQQRFAPQPSAGGIGGLSPEVLNQLIEVLSRRPPMPTPFGAPPSAPPSPSFGSIPQPKITIGDESRNPTPRPSTPSPQPPSVPTVTLPSNPTPPAPPPAPDFPRTPWGDFYAPDYGPFGTEG